MATDKFAYLTVLLTLCSTFDLKVNKQQDSYRNVKRIPLILTTWGYKDAVQAGKNVLNFCLFCHYVGRH